MAPASLWVWTWKMCELCLLLRGQTEKFLSLQSHIRILDLLLVKDQNTYPVPNPFNHFIGYLVVDQFGESMLSERCDESICDFLPLGLSAMNEFTEVKGFEFKCHI